MWGDAAEKRQNSIAHIREQQNDIRSVGRKGSSRKGLSRAPIRLCARIPILRSHRLAYGIEVRGRDVSTLSCTVTIHNVEQRVQLTNRGQVLLSVSVHEGSLSSQRNGICQGRFEDFIDFLAISGSEVSVPNDHHLFQAYRDWPS